MMKIVTDNTLIQFKKIDENFLIEEWRDVNYLDENIACASTIIKSPVQYRKYNNKVIIKGMINLNISSKNYDHNLTTPIFRLPQGYRPSASVFKIVPCLSSTKCKTYASRRSRYRFMV